MAVILMAMMTMALNISHSTQCLCQYHQIFYGCSLILTNICLCLCLCLCLCHCLCLCFVFDTVKHSVNTVSVSPAFLCVRFGLLFNLRVKGTSVQTMRNKDTLDFPKHRFLTAAIQLYMESTEEMFFQMDCRYICGIFDDLF